MSSDFNTFPKNYMSHLPLLYRIKAFFRRIWNWFFPKKTSVKPTGVSSLVMGRASGIEPVVSEKYIRIVSYSLVKDQVFPYGKIDPRINTRGMEK